MEWTNEALGDPEVLRIAPDPASRSGRSIRTIGYSPQAGCLITVITVDEEGVTYGVNSWEIERHRHRPLQEGTSMSDIEKIIEEETDASEANRDAPIPEGAKVTRPNRGRSTVYSIRLNPAEVAALQSLAETAGVPGSTLARSWIVERIQEEQAGLSDAEAELRAVQRHLAHLQKHLQRHAS